MQNPETQHPRQLARPAARSSASSGSPTSASTTCPAERGSRRAARCAEPPHRRPRRRHQAGAPEPREQLVSWPRISRRPSSARFHGILDGSRRLRPPRTVARHLDLRRRRLRLRRRDHRRRSERDRHVYLGGGSRTCRARSTTRSTTAREHGPAARSSRSSTSSGSSRPSSSVDSGALCRHGGDGRRNRVGPWTKPPTVVAWRFARSAGSTSRSGTSRARCSGSPCRS